VEGQDLNEMHQTGKCLMHNHILKLKKKREKEDVDLSDGNNITNQLDDGLHNII
jgi:hypothetical protein